MLMYFIVIVTVMDHRVVSRDWMVHFILTRIIELCWYVINCIVLVRDRLHLACRSFTYFALSTASLCKTSSLRGKGSKSSEVSAFNMQPQMEKMMWSHMELSYMHIQQITNTLLVKVHQVLARARFLLCLIVVAIVVEKAIIEKLGFCPEMTPKFVLPTATLTKETSLNFPDRHSPIAWIYDSISSRATYTRRVVRKSKRVGEVFLVELTHERINCHVPSGLVLGANGAWEDAKDALVRGETKATMGL
uniref:Uncharacterized protein LOC113784330 isoform X1 n=1 Tax=Cicer arietinum TaxID=3827 RepID=A0A3Q7XIQ5_CICAR|nr:uncharacterized protein LOC113784330 isoform X1 [Cicer arietinum]